MKILQSNTLVRSQNSNMNEVKLKHQFFICISSTNYSSRLSTWYKSNSTKTEDVNVDHVYSKLSYISHKPLIFLYHKLGEVYEKRSSPISEFPRWKYEIHNKFYTDVLIKQSPFKIHSIKLSPFYHAFIFRCLNGLRIHQRIG